MQDVDEKGREAAAFGLALLAGAFILALAKFGLLG